MIKYYANRELSEELDVKLAKWKRWSREFLPPDPLGGMQSGYTRQYTPDEAFTVYLGGHLVADLHFTIPAARQILQDLREWLSESGFGFNAGPLVKMTGQHGTESIHQYQIYITPAARDDVSNAAKSDAGIALFRYLIRGILSEGPMPGNELDTKAIHLTETTLPDPTIDPPHLGDLKIVQMLNITAVLKDFIERLDLKMTDYPVFV